MDSVVLYTYHVHSNFWMETFSKSRLSEILETLQYFQKQSRDIASCYYYSVIFKT